MKLCLAISLLAVLPGTLPSAIDEGRCDVVLSIPGAPEIRITYRTLRFDSELKKRMQKTTGSERLRDEQVLIRPRWKATLETSSRLEVGGARLESGTYQLSFWVSEVGALELTAVEGRQRFVF